MNSYQFTFVNDESYEHIKVQAFSFDEAMAEARELTLLDNITKVIGRQQGVVLHSSDEMLNSIKVDKL